MRLYLDWRKRVLVDVQTENSGLKVRLWQKVSPPAEPEDKGPALRATGHSQSIERRGWTSSPDTVVFGFGRRR